MPALGRLFANPAIRGTTREANRYLRDREGIGAAVRALLRAELDCAWAADARVLLIGHSLGSVICYDTLWDLSRERGANPRVDLFMTLGSPLATHVIRRGLRGAGQARRRCYPCNIARWVNLTARADTTALQPRPRAALPRDARPRPRRSDRGPYVDLENCFRGPFGLNTARGLRLSLPAALAEIVGEFIERG